MSKPMRFFDFYAEGKSLEEFEVERRREAVRILQILTGPAFYFYAIYSFHLKAYTAAFLNAFGAILVTAGFLISLKRFETERSHLVYHIVSIMFFMSLTTLLINVFGIYGAMDYIGWIFIYPPLAFLLLGKRLGLLIMVVYFLGVFFSFIFNQSAALMSQGMANLKFHSLVALACLAIITFVNENSRASTQKQLFSEKTRLKDLNDNLEKIVLRVKESENDLTRAKGELELKVEQRTVELISINDRLQREINERKQAEETLQESESYFRSLLFNMHEDILVVDRDYRITDVNNTSLTTVGLRREEVIGRPCYEVLHGHNEPCARRGERCLLHIVFETCKPRSSRHLHRRFDGSKVWVDILLSPLKDEHGNVTHVIEAVRDVTDLIQAEEGLRESEERYRTAIEHSNDGVAIIQEKRYLFVNQRFVEIFGYDRPEEIVGNPLSMVVHIDGLKRIEEMTHWGERRESVPSRYEFKGIRKNGEVIDLEVSATETNYCGRAVSLAYLRDITERKRADQEMAILQEQFRQSQKMEAIGQLAGGIAHDFNNLLTIIQGYTDLSLSLLRERDPMRENIHGIGKAAERASDLTRQLLAFSRRQVMEMKVLDLNTLLRDLDKMLRRVIGEDIELVTILPEDLGRIKADPGQIEQVILNLAVNARDAMASGGKLMVETANIELDQVYARKHVSVNPGHYVMLSVGDTGVGMNPEVKDRIFEPFFTTKGKGKGTGLGLSTVYGIVKQSGGNVWVYSEPGQGATFKIYLPRMDQSLKEEKKRVVMRELPRGNETVLVVEDEEEVLKVTVEILRRQGYKVFEASQGGDALLICEEYEDPIHLMVTDVVMPRMSGSELAKRLEPLHPEMRVLYMSGYTDNAIVHHGILEEGVNYLQKPFTVDSLARRVREVLDK